ncbi:ATP-dependent RecD-like DNA helicase, partial [[Ruminococcus] gnavus]|uniref:SF1B family DNA helicase RecD2 n=1 Tax=Mediterraneibacter gnavus TaxID=33038 RepID=UPI002109D2C8
NPPILLAISVTKMLDHNNSHGTQYKVETFLEVVPRTREGILGYLSCGSLKGIGPKTAERIVNRFGLDTLEVMEKYPQELLKIQGISQKKLDRIVDSFGKNKVFRELMTFLSPFHVTPKKANMILQKFRDQSVEIIRKQPYILCSVKGFGFLTVDAIARQCCAATNDPMRISGCVSYVLREAMKQNGHLYLEQEILVKDALKVLNKEPDLQPVTETEILKVLYRLVMQDSIVVEENRVYITKQHQEEEDTASMIARKLHERIPALTIEKELEEAQEDLNITLSEQQKEAVRMVFANPICIITGGPGTGKTTVLKVILYIYQKKCGNEVKLMAPTGRAARRMAESTGNGDATTMHMALGLFGDGDYEALTDKLSADFINADEVSMVDMHLAYEFFYKIKAGARVLLVGDVHQLPSVGAGDVFRQLILCGKIPVTVLNLVYRQGKDSNIPINAQLINEGKTNLQWGDDFQMVECSGADAAAQIVKNIYLKEIQMYGMEQVQILSPYKVRSAAGVLELNRSLQDEVNPPVSGKRELHLGGEMFREGDRILQNKNTEFASNGDLGTLVQIAEDEDNNPLVQIVFTDGRRVKYEAEQVEMIEHANAITIHKSQGSECQVVIIPWLKAFYPMLKRNIFYTGITRAKQRVYIVGEWKAVCQAIHTDDTGTRKTMLAVKIQQYCEWYQRQENRRIPATICNRAV